MRNTEKTEAYGKNATCLVLLVPSTYSALKGFFDVRLDLHREGGVPEPGGALAHRLYLGVGLRRAGTLTRM